MRPIGEISRVLLEAAAVQPGTVLDLAARTQVGFDAARYTATRLVQRGDLVRLSDGRPAVLGLPCQADAMPAAEPAAEPAAWDGWRAAPDTPLGQLREDAFACL